MNKVSDVVYQMSNCAAICMSWRVHVTLEEKMMMSALYQTDTLSQIFSFSLLKQASEKTIRTIGIYFIIVIQSQPLFAMHYKRKNRKYQFYSLWFNPTASRTHQSNRTRGYNHAVYDEYIVKSNQTHCYFILKVYFTAVISLILYKK